MIQVFEMNWRDGIQRRLLDAFRREMVEKEGEHPEGMVNESWCMREMGRCQFNSKEEADKFINWLMTFDSWTEEFCPIRVKHYK